MRFTCSTLDFKNAIQDTSFAVMESGDDNRVLEGVSIKYVKGDKHLTLIGCDGYRLATYEVSVETKAKKDIQVTLSPYWLEEVVKTIKAKGEIMTLNITSDEVTVKSKGTGKMYSGKLYKTSYPSIDRVKPLPINFIWQALLFKDTKKTLIDEFKKIDSQKGIGLDNYNTWLVLSPLGLEITAKRHGDHLSEGIYIGRILLQDIALSSRVYPKYVVVIEAKHFYDSLTHSAKNTILRGFSSFSGLSDITMYPNTPLDCSPLEIAPIWEHGSYQCIMAVQLSNKLKYPELFTDEVY